MLKTRILTLVPSAAQAFPALARQTDQPACLVATLQVSEHDACFKSYGGPVFPLLDAAGAKVPVGTPSAQTPEGDDAAT